MSWALEMCPVWSVGGSGGSTVTDQGQSLRGKCVENEGGSEKRLSSVDGFTEKTEKTDLGV